MDHTDRCNRPLPELVRIERLFPAGQKLILPRHQPGAVHVLGVFGAGLPVILMAIGVAVMCFLATFGIVRANEVGGPRWGFFLFGIFFGLAGTGLCVFELFTFLAHVEIELAHGRLKAIQRVGPLRWTRQCLLSEIERLNVPDAHSAFGWEGRGIVLIAELSKRAGVDSVQLAEHYPKEWLLQVAGWLAEQINRERLNSGEAPVTAVSETIADRLQKPIAEQPAVSQIRVQPLGDDLILRVPAPGLLTYGGGAGALCGVMGLGTLAVTGVLAFNLDVPGMIGFLAVAGLSTVFAFALFLYMWNGAQRRTVLTVTADRLKVEQMAPFGSHRHDWHRDKIASVGVGPSKFTVRSNAQKRHLPELQIRPHKAEPFPLFPGRDEDELRWLATVLEEYLQLETSEHQSEACRESQM